MNAMISTPSGRIICRVPVESVHIRAQMFLTIPCDAVAVLGGVGDWAAYVGSKVLSDAEIYSCGVKLRAHEAAELFPFMNEGSYRP